MGRALGWERLPRQSQLCSSPGDTGAPGHENSPTAATNLPIPRHIHPLTKQAVSKRDTAAGSWGGIRLSRVTGFQDGVNYKL